MSSIQHLFENNQTWAEEVTEKDADFFKNLAEQQSPEYLWIGCSDSRVPANQLLNLAPGEVFVHRNIANQVIHTDLNCLSVIQYAVEVLKVKHIIVCGHYGCGGVAAALADQSFGLIDNWLRHIQDVYRFHKEKFSNISDEAEQVKMLCELNVIEQVGNVCSTTILRRAWENGQNVTVHGLIYDLQDGKLKDLDLNVSSVKAGTCLFKNK